MEILMQLAGSSPSIIGYLSSSNSIILIVIGLAMFLLAERIGRLAKFIGLLILIIAILNLLNINILSTLGLR